MMEFTEAIRDYLKENLKVKVKAGKHGNVTVTLMLEGEILSTDNSKVDTSPIVYGARPSPRAMRSKE